jgi:hypothetical protein
MYSLENIYENIYLNVSYDFSKFDGSKKIKVWWFLVVPPKDTLTFLLNIIWYQTTIALNAWGDGPGCSIF